MSESEFLIVLGVMARENDLLRYRLDQAEKENMILRENMRVGSHIKKEAAE